MAETQTLARGLGWFSIGLGLAELTLAETLTRALGMEGRENLVRAYGAREIGAGVGILFTSGTTPGWVWGRVAGDALDLATLAAALHSGNPKGGSVGVAIATVAGVTALDILCAEQLSAARAPARVAVPAGQAGAEPGETDVTPSAHQVTRSITIGKPASELQALWRDPQVQAQTHGHFADTQASGSMDGVMRWEMHAPLGQTYRWQSRITSEQEGKYTRFASLPGGDLPSEGELTFRPAPADWGTEVTFHFRFEPPGGLVGKAAARLNSSVPDTLVNDVLRRFKALAEIGEIPTLAGNVSARCGKDTV